MRLIDADALIDKLNEYIKAPHLQGNGQLEYGARMAISTCIGLAKMAKTVETEPVRHGRKA